MRRVVVLVSVAALLFAVGMWLWPIRGDVQAWRECGPGFVDPLRGSARSRYGDEIVCEWPARAVPALIVAGLSVVWLGAGLLVTRTSRNAEPLPRGR